MRSLYRSLMKWPLCFLAWALLGAGAYFVLRAAGQKSWIAVAVTAGGALILTIVWYALLKKRAEEEIAQLSTETGEALEDKMMQLANPYALIGENGRIVWRNEAFDQMLEDHGTDKMVLSDRLSDIFPDVGRL